jgi:hypothetical protein
MNERLGARPTSSALAAPERPCSWAAAGRRRRGLAPELIENGRADAETLGRARGTLRFERLHERLETAATG